MRGDGEHRVSLTIISLTGSGDVYTDPNLPGSMILAKYSIGSITQVFKLLLKKTLSQPSSRFRDRMYFSDVSSLP